MSAFPEVEDPLRMTRLLAKAFLIIFAITAYIGSPFVTAWSIREAVRSGDSAYLERAIDWPSVRTTLKPAIGRIALNLPDAEAQPGAKPGLWQRFKAYWGQGAVDRAIDGYLTPEGLPQLFAIRKAYRGYVAGDPDDVKAPVFERMKRAWARVKRAEFTGLTTFEVDMADKYDESRIFLGKLELTSLGWKLRELRVKFLTTADTTVQKFSSANTRAPNRAWSTGFISRAEALPLPAPKASFWDRAKSAAR